MGCDTRWSHSYTSVPSFNPRTRMGCDRGQALRICSDKSVSIHAPAWGATDFVSRPELADNVSIHAPAWGATNVWDNMVVTDGFQSTHPHGVRPLWTCGNGLIICFNPRTRMGCDRNSRFDAYSYRGFQSTHPHGVRRIDGKFLHG